MPSRKITDRLNAGERLLLDGATDSGSGEVEKQLRRPEEVAELLELYKEIPVETAKRAMRFWAIRQKSQEDGAATP